ncbi:preprotein translocase subunit SecE [Peptoniphilus asaccharolyticus DSM 20463]|uniref:Protein translocase subunit SecE n=3 Tax=Peptoniphilus TaxID=162289 RepID=G4D2X1_9FIRM|nr:MULTISPECIES: preprotein translocase subunit SecE [Peptoniphilus]EGY80137.1 preprotein translocase [Peptoniphilus indolicus ATCC 29427]MBL7575975.1 preprotein translocase subunit SecE [Peptoniphilus asaccharolyticus]MDY2986419.1 preprotein translocase subunit SecE [Peptoniphilus sp.]SMB88949.1 preprotein translocase subunit SecE [Peptoniphilus asaccharolyticus DSM 20463]SUB75165.1 Preprotein translocase subunit secE [Peptoniphilus indolicus]
MATSKESVQKVEDKSLGKYFRGVKSEFKKVVWPTKKEIVNLSMIVITAVIAFSILLTIYDKIVMFLLNLIIG